MDTSLLLIRACATAEPGDFLPYLVAADHFADRDEGDDRRLERVLRWMAANGKYPHKVDVRLPNPNVTSVTYATFNWYTGTPSELARVSVPEHAVLPPDLCPLYRSYKGWLAAVFALADKFA